MANTSLSEDRRCPSGASALSRAVFAFLLGSVAACAPVDPGEGTGTGGASSGGASASGGSQGTGGSNASGGATSSGGAPASGGKTGSGGSSSGGSTGSGGASATGGAAGSGRGGSTGTGGRGTGGGSAGGTGSGGSSTPGAVAPSAGCGKSGRPANGRITTTNEFITDFPTTYDGMKPFPLLMAMHACGNQNNQWENLTKGSAFETDYIRWMPNTVDSGQCWNNYANNVARVLKQFDDLLANYCVDTNHIFAVGHSSGAQMLVKIVAQKTDIQHLKIRAIAPVAADPYKPAIPMPVLYIDGIKDNQRGANSAKDTVALYRTANGCMSTSTTYAPIMGCKSSDGGGQVDPGCIAYDGCTVPTIWCAHNDPNYSGTQHGVPCFGLKAMTDFFATFK